jgi:hypothetical protein
LHGDDDQKDNHDGDQDGKGDEKFFAHSNFVWFEACLLVPGTKKVEGKKIKTPLWISFHGASLYERNRRPGTIIFTTSMVSFPSGNGYVMGMTATEFRKLALAHPGAVESAHMDHPDFRIGVEGRIFASLGYPDDHWGMVKLTPEQQAAFVKQAPAAFKPCAGVWGERGATNVHLASIQPGILKAALDAAFQNVANPVRPKSKKPLSGPKSAMAGQRGRQPRALVKRPPKRSARVRK